MGAATVWRPRTAPRALAAADPHLARLIEAVGPIRIPQRPSTFASLARSIVYQQLSGAAASTIWGRLEAKLGGQVEAADVHRRRVPTLRSAGLSAAKARSLKDLAAHVVRGDLDPPGLARLPDEEVVARLVAVWGIGPWSAHMHLMFSLRRPDVWPTLDLGVRKGLQRFLGLDAPPDAGEAEGLGSPYSPFRTCFAWLMWRVLELDVWKR